MKHFKAKIIDNKLIIDKPKLWQDNLNFLNGKEIIITVEKLRKKRTNLQNRALHLYFTQVAEALNNAGYDMKKLIKEEVDIPWNTINVKNYIWRPIQREYLKKKSTTRLKSDEIDQVYEIVNRLLAEKTKIHVPFPSIELLFNRE